MAARRKAARSVKAAKTLETAKTVSLPSPDVSPLGIMLGAMRELWAQAESLKGKPDASEERLALIRQASAEAHKAAVYVHRRLASADTTEESDSAMAASAVETGAHVRSALGSRELARRLLFAVACAEAKSRIIDKERS